MQTLAGIKDGTITVAFRKWKRPTVKAGGTLLTRVGQLAIHSVDVVDETAISEETAIAAGYPSVDDLLADLAKRPSGNVFQIAFQLLGPDPRIALRLEIPSSDELASLAERLARLDRSSRVGPWTQTALELIQSKPAIRAGDLAEEMGLEKEFFKKDIRKLKKFGLTESLEVGYRLSPRGSALLNHIQSRN